MPKGRDEHSLTPDDTPTPMPMPSHGNILKRLLSWGSDSESSCSDWEKRDPYAIGGHSQKPRFSGPKARRHRQDPNASG